MDHYQMIKQSVAYIENNLNRTISLDELAAQAYCSKYYFHRTFKAMTGEAAIDYIRNKRLKRASSLLLRTDMCISSIANECGFTFHESFTRIFKKKYGVSPEEYRNNKRIHLTREKMDIARNRLPEKPAALSEPSIIEESGLLFIGVKCFTDRSTFSEQNNVVKLWNNFNHRVSEVKNRVDRNASFGIGLYNTSPQLGYIACVKVEKAECVPKGMDSKRIPPSSYAKFTHKGEDMNLTASLDYIFSTWLTGKEYKLSGEIDFIVRMDERHTGGGDSKLDIFIPIRQER